QTLTINTESTTTSVASSANPSAFGQPVTFTATVSPSTSGTPTGTVQFKIDGSNFGSPITLSGGTASSGSISSLSVTSHSITAVSSGTSISPPSPSPPQPQPVTRPATSPSVGPSLNPSAFGQSVTSPATVTAPSPGAGVPTGTVPFRDGPTPLGTGTLSSGTAS